MSFYKKKKDDKFLLHSKLNYTYQPITIVKRPKYFEHFAEYADHLNWKTYTTTTAF